MTPIVDGFIPGLYGVLLVFVYGVNLCFLGVQVTLNEVSLDGMDFSLDRMAFSPNWMVCFLQWMVGFLQWMVEPL